jgi:rhamnosyltransferase
VGHAEASIEHTESEPSVLVLLAAHNGKNHLETQIHSILAQYGVETRIVVSVDRSDDDTEDLVEDLTTRDPRVMALSYGTRFGGAAPNFFHLIQEVAPIGGTYIALSDQDDVWFPDKLMNAVRTLKEKHARAYSSNVFAWFPDNRLALIDKAGHQKAWDHFFSGAGPGCTYVMDAAMFNQLAMWLKLHRADLHHIELHDWLIYAWARKYGFSWVIDPRPTMLYRQHHANQFGANRGVRAAASRLRRIHNGWYASQILRIGSCLNALDLPPLAPLNHPTAGSRLRLLLMAPHIRRRLSEGILVALLVPMSPNRLSRTRKRADCKP